MKKNKLLDEIKKKLKKHYGTRLKEVVLFGSRARGESHEQSDYDVLVILNEPANPARERRETGDIIYKICWENDVVISCHFLSHDRYISEQSPFLMNARREGITL